MSSTRSRKRLQKRKHRLRALAIAKEFGIAPDDAVVDRLHAVVQVNPTPSFQEVAAIFRSTGHDDALRNWLEKNTKMFQLAGAEAKASSCSCCRD